MQVLLNKYPGLMIICEGCGSVLADIKPSDIYGNNFVYCPICKHQNILNFDKTYDGMVKNDVENNSND